MGSEDSARLKKMAAGHHAHLVYHKSEPQSPNSLEDFHWIGFDLDYTVARYHNDLANLIQTCIIRALRRSGYEATCFEGFDRSVVQKGIIVDYITGDLIKLNAEGRVTTALHGTEWRTEESIAAVYGTGPWRFFGSLQQQARHDDYFLFVTAFDSPVLPLWACIVARMDRRDPSVAHVPPGDYQCVRRHIGDAFNWIFDNKLAWESESAAVIVLLARYGTCFIFKFLPLNTRCRWPRRVL